MLADAGGVRGDAVAVLARHLSEEYSVGLMTAARLATDLLAHFSDARLSCVAGWVRSGWHGSVGELLDASAQACT